MMITTLGSNAFRPGPALRGLVAALLVATSLAATPAQDKHKVMVLGVDGMDPEFLRQFSEEGMLPNLTRLMREGDFKPLQTSMPPLSPVAWSTFITGMDPGGHGIFDFIHREPDTLRPFLSMSRTLPPSRSLNLGGCVLPLAGGVVENLRQGRAFWELLEQRGVPTTIFRMPANYPPTEAGGQAFSGMGTPDIKGTPGTFAFYTNRPVPNAKDISGGKVYPVRVIDNTVETKLFGPANAFWRIPRPMRSGELRYDNPDMELEFTVWLDPEQPLAKFQVQDDEFILREGEWSPWVRVDFEAQCAPFGERKIPLFVSISAIGRFYLKQVRPDFELYVTPLQINPEDPALPISTPDKWAHELFESLGYFYTQELPEDTKALSGGIFTGREFWDQAQFVYRERRRALEHFLSRYEQLDHGFMFFYFSSVDQGSHMMWRYADDAHPGFQGDEKLLHSIRTLYRELDEAVGRVMEFIGPDDTLIVMSDHGFAPFYWGVNLNTWLLNKGYVKLKDPSRQGTVPFFGNVDWSQTKAYALGLNGLYINLRGREKQGIVNVGREYEALLNQLEQDLLELRDPRNDARVVTLVIQTGRDFRGPEIKRGPDIIVGYNKGYRSSWESPLGEFPRELFVDNEEAWSGDHAMDYRHVPGVLLTNQRITHPEPALYDLTVGILDEFGIEKIDVMLGSDCLGPREPTAAARGGGATASRDAPLAAE